MATAEEIFSPNSTEEPHIVIGSDRVIKVPNSLKRLAVQHDHNVETVTFDCPRYWDDLDMSTMAIYINYVLSDGYADSYIAKGITVDDNIMHFTWTISRNVTQTPGTVRFLVCIKKSDANGIEVNHWNSELCQDTYISAGMETAEQVALENTDLITQLLLRMDTVEKINVKADEMQALLDETKAAAATAEEVKNEALDASDYIKNSYANAIKGNASGEVVRVDDVSPITHTAKVKVCSKNLASFGTYPITLSGKEIHDVETACNVTAPFTITYETTVENDRGTGAALFVLLYDDGTESYSVAKTSSGLNTLTINNGKKLVKIRLANWNAINGSLNWFQIEEGDTATEYEPYIDPSTVTVTGCGKNICECNTLATPNTSDTFCEYSACITKPMVLSFKISSNYAVSSQIWRANVSYADGTVYYINDHDLMVGSLYEKAFYGTKDNPITTIRMRNTFITAGELSNIQIELGEIATDYEPYNGKSYTPNQNGDVEVTSVSPIITLFTDTDGVTIDLEYNKDLNKAFNEIMSMITSIIGVVVFDEELVFTYDEGSAMYLASCSDVSAITDGTYVLKVGDGAERNITIAYSDDAGYPTWSDESGEIFAIHATEGSDSYIGFVREALSSEGTYRIKLTKKS